MTAWMRYQAGVFGLLAGCLTIGCQPQEPGLARGPNEGSAVSHVPRWEMSEDGVLHEPEILPNTHFAAGRMHESRGHLARAVQQYRLAIELDPKHFEAYNRIGVVLDRMRDYEQADAAFLRAIEIAPNRAYLHNNLGFSYLMQQRFKEAQTVLEKAVELHPDFARAHVNLAVCLSQQQQFEAALTHFRQALLLEDAYFNMGLMYQSQNRPSDAARAFKTALELNPKMAAAQKHLDKLPEEVVQSAEPFPIEVASPPAVEPQDAQPSEPKVLPATQPAEGAASPEEPAGECVGSSVDLQPVSASDEVGTEQPGDDDASPPTAEPAPSVSEESDDSGCTDTPLRDDSEPTEEESAESQPACLNMSIETRMEQRSSWWDDPHWLAMIRVPGSDDPFGPEVWIR